MILDGILASVDEKFSYERFLPVRRNNPLLTFVSKIRKNVILSQKKCKSLKLAPHSVQVYHTCDTAIYRDQTLLNQLKLGGESAHFSIINYDSVYTGCMKKSNLAYLIKSRPSATVESAKVGHLRLCALCVKKDFITRIGIIFGLNLFFVGMDIYRQSPVLFVCL